MPAKDEMFSNDRSPDEVLGEITDLIKSDVLVEELQGKYDELADEMREIGVKPPELQGLQVGAREERTFEAKELRISRDNGSEKIVGYAAVFDQLSVELWGFREKIAPGAFAKTINEADIRSLFNHDPNYVLGRNKSGTLSLAEDEIGLLIEVEPPDTQWARDLATSIDRGDVSQMSFGFETVNDEWETVDEESIRTLVEVKLFDVSPVTFPAYLQTTVQLRDLEGVEFAGLTEAIAQLRTGSATDAHKAIAARFIDSINKLLTAAPDQGIHAADDRESATAQGRNAARRRRLALMRIREADNG